MSQAGVRDNNQKDSERAHRVDVGEAPRCK